MADAPSPSTGTTPVAIFVHVYYLDIWREISGLLEDRVDVPFRLVITSPHEPDHIPLPASPDFKGSTIHRLENRGRDILPFLRVLDAESGSFDIGLKLHTKHSPHRRDGGEWRRSMLESLLPESGVRSLVEAIGRHPRIGLVAPEGFFVPNRGRVEHNMEPMRAAAAKAAIPLDARGMRQGRFPAGSMFWFRGEALARFRSPGLAEMFEPETGQLDATAAHAIERLFAMGAEAEGFVAMPVDALGEARPEHSPDELRRLARRHAAVSPHARLPFPLLSAARRLLPWLAPCYRALPEGLKSRIRRLP